MRAVSLAAPAALKVYIFKSANIYELRDAPTNAIHDPISSLTSAGRGTANGATILVKCMYEL